MQSSKKFQIKCKLLKEVAVVAAQEVVHGNSEPVQEVTLEVVHVIAMTGIVIVNVIVAVALNLESVHTVAITASLRAKHQSALTAVGTASQKANPTRDLTLEIVHVVIRVKMVTIKSRYLIFCMEFRKVFRILQNSFKFSGQS